MVLWGTIGVGVGLSCCELWSLFTKERWTIKKALALLDHPHIYVFAEKLIDSDSDLFDGMD